MSPEYSPRFNCMIYAVSDPTAILTVIPEARRLADGRIAVPVELRAMQVMRLFGFPAMSPIEREYGFPSKYPRPRPNQLVTAAFKTLHPRNMDVSQMRTGKSMASLWAIDYLRSKNILRKVLILAPLSTLWDVWDKEVYTSFYGKMRGVVVHGDREDRLRLLKAKADVFILNHDGIKVGSKRSAGKFTPGPLIERLLAMEDLDLVLVDEISAFKHAESDRYKVLDYLLRSKPNMWRWGLTGTPAANRPTDAWAIGRLIYGKEDRPESFESFRMRTMMRLSEFKWIPRVEAPRIVADWLQPSIRYTRKELGFPELTYETQTVPMSPKQKEAYEAMRATLELWTSTGQRIDAVNEAALRTKLIQISSGAVYGPDHSVHHVDAKPRLDALEEIIEEAGGKVLVFSGLTSVIDMIHSSTHKKFRAERVNGHVSPSKRKDIFAAFRRDRDFRMLIADPATMAHGLDFSCAETVVWFGPIDNNEHYDQANSRIVGPESAGLVIHLASSPVDKELYRRLQEKQQMQGAVLALLRSAA